MTVDNLQVLDIIEVMEAFLERKRPPEHIRPKLDIGYKIEGQSIIIHEIRPFWNDASKIIHPEVAKATFVKAMNDVPMDTAIELLGHTDIRTTQLHGKIVQKKISSDMSKLRMLITGSFGIALDFVFVIFNKT